MTDKMIREVRQLAFDELYRHSQALSHILEDIALHYFGDLSNLIPFSKVKLPPVGRTDYVLARHKPMQAEIDDFVLVELPLDSNQDFEQTILNKGIICEAWNIKSYWIFPENVYANLVKRFGFIKSDYHPLHACRFVLYDLIPQGDLLTLTPTRYASATIDEIDHLPGISNVPSKDKFVQNLNARLRTELLGGLAKLTRRIN